MCSVCLPRRPAVAYLSLVRPMNRGVRRYTFIVIIALTITAGWAAAPGTRREQPVVRITRKPTGTLYSALPTIELYRDGFVWIQRSEGTTLTRTIGVAFMSEEI